MKETGTLEPQGRGEEGGDISQVRIQVFDVCLPVSVAVKDQEKDGILKKLECED